MHTAKPGEGVVQTILQRALQKARLLVNEVVAGFPGGDTETRGARAQQLADRGVGHDKVLFGTVRLGHAHVEVASVAGGVQVVDDEGAGGDRGFQQHVAGLANGDTRIGAGDATDNRRISAHGVGQHAVITGQLYAAIRQGVEDLTAGVGLTYSQLAFQRSDIALRVAVQRLVLATVARLPAHRGIVTQAPVAQIEACIEPQERRVIGAAAGAVAIGIEVITEHPCSDATVPQFRADIATRVTLQGRLRDAEVKCLVLRGEVRTGALNQTAQRRAAWTLKRQAGFG